MYGTGSQFYNLQAILLFWTYDKHSHYIWSPPELNTIPPTRSKPSGIPVPVRTLPARDGVPSTSHRQFLNTGRRQFQFPAEVTHHKEADVRQPVADTPNEALTSEFTSLVTTPSSISSLLSLSPSPPPIVPTHIPSMSTPPPRAATKGPAYMPAPGPTRAPDKFKGNSSQLRDFLEEFEGHAAAQELTDDEKVRSILKYVDGMTRSYWKTLDSYEEQDWEKMKTELFDAYCHALPDFASLPIILLLITFLYLPTVYPELPLLGTPLGAPQRVIVKSYLETLPTWLGPWPDTSHLSYISSLSVSLNSVSFTSVSLLCLISLNTSLNLLRLPLVRLPSPVSALPIPPRTALAAAAKGHRYTVKGLLKLAESNALNRIEEEADLIEYYRQFCIMSRLLKIDKKVTTDEINRYFWYGIHKLDRKEILGRIELKDSAFDRTTVPDMERVLKMGREVFNDNVLGMEMDDPIADMFTKPKKKKAKVIIAESSSESEESSDSSSEDESDEEKAKKKTVKQDVRTKVVEKPRTDNIEDLAKQLQALHVHDVNYAGVYAKLVAISPVVASAIAALPPIPQAAQTAAIPAIQMTPYPNPPTNLATYPNSIPTNGNSYRRGSQPQRQASGPLPTDILCFFCKENHLIRDCSHLPVRPGSKWVLG
ncbi:hypothetical protein F5051DRAFT_488235 [Lentinula edodes]|nr:hypothetical protein F5051DRAFT_488235 [Lentinula edodes]